MNTFKELTVDAPWGQISLVAWGDPYDEPVLLVHGRQDSAATFIPLVQLLQKRFYYVAVDLPGNGKSDHYPKGLTVSRYLYIHIIIYIAKKMDWKRFTFIGHSMGCEFGLFFNAVCPGYITRFILLDPGPTFQRLQQPDHERFYKHYYDRYYSNYKRYNSNKSKVYTKKQALEAVMKARGLTESQADILSRSLVQIGEDKYRLSWDPRTKYVVSQNLPNDHYLQLFAKEIPPTLIISMTEGSDTRWGKDGADQLLSGLVQIRHVEKVVLAGKHDHHVTNPEEVAKHVNKFLNEDCSVMAKL